MSFNPYPGLRSFEYKEYELFYGREGQAEEVLRRLQKSHFLAVVGTSGSGKSSLVKAGLLPLLYSGLMFSAGAQWRVAMFRPGNNPIHSLARALVYPPAFVPKTTQTEINPLDINDEMKVGVVETILRRSAVGLVDYVKGSNLAPQENLLIVVDQFEELFRYKEHAAGQDSVETEDKAAFVKLLLNAVHDENIRNIYIVITMRSDYLGDCAQFRDLPEAINDGQYLIPRMTRDQMREAIEEPAEMADEPAKISELLVNRLLNDIGDNQDQLPILQHALMRTWKEWVDEGKPPEITVEHYERAGGMAKALSRHADKVYDNLSKNKKILKERQVIAEKMFRCLTNIDSGNRETRRETELGEICRIINANISEVIPVVEAFRSEGRTFLLPPTDVTLDENCVIDISHESLIRNWEKLKKWVDDEAEWASLYRRLANDALLHLNERVSHWSDPALQIALDWKNEFKPNADWAERYHPAFDEAMKFLDESEAAREVKIIRDRERQERELKLAKESADAKEREAAILAKAANRLRWMVGALAVMFLVSFISAVVSYYFYREAISSERTTLEAKDVIDRQNGELSSRFRDIEIAKDETDQANQALVETEKELRDALKKAQDSEEAQKRLTDEAQEARNEAEQNAETAKKAEAAATEALKKAEKATADAKIAEDETQKTLVRERKSRAASTLVERGNYVRAIQLFNELAKEYETSALPDKQTGQWWMLHNLGTAQWKIGNLGAAHQTYIDALKALGEKIEDSDIARSEQVEPAQAKSFFVKTAFQPQAEVQSEQFFSKIATYRKLGQVNRERALTGAGDTTKFYRWARLGYERFFSLYDQTSPDKEFKFVIEVRRELGDVYLALTEFDKAKEQFTKVLNIYDSLDYVDLRIVVEMQKKLSEVELRRGNYEAASLEIKKGIDEIESYKSSDYRPTPLVAELYDARAQVYTERSRAAEVMVNDIDNKLNPNPNRPSEIALAAEQKQKLEDKRAIKAAEQTKFSDLASDYSAVAVEIRNLSLPVNSTLEVKDFSLESYSNLAEAYLKINKCQAATEVMKGALARAQNIASKTGNVDTKFLPEQIFKIIDTLRIYGDKESVKSIYLDFVDELTDEKVLQAFSKVRPSSAFTVYKYNSAGHFLKKDNPDTAIKYFEAYIKINKIKARIAYGNLYDVIYAYNSLADIAFSQGDSIKAEKLYEEAIEVIKNFEFQNRSADTTPSEATVKEVLIAEVNVFQADFYRLKANNRDLARELYKKAADVFERNLDTAVAYEESIYILKNRAEIEKEDNNLVQAAQYFEQAIDKLEKVKQISPRLLGGRYFTPVGNNVFRFSAYYRDYASMLVSLVEIKGTGDAALVKKRDDAVKDAAGRQPSIKAENETSTESCKNGIEPEFEEKKKTDEPVDEESVNEDSET